MKNCITLVLIVISPSLFSQNELPQKPKVGFIFGTSFSSPELGSSSKPYSILSAGIYKHFSLKSKFLGMPFIRAEIMFGGRKADFFNKNTSQIETVSSGAVDLNVIFPARWSLTENVFCNVGLGAQVGIGPTSVFSNATPTAQKLSTSINASAGILVDANVSFGGKTNACIGIRNLITFSAYNYQVSSFYFGFSLPDLRPKEE